MSARTPWRCRDCRASCAARNDYRTKTYTEERFEDHITAHLLAAGYHLCATSPAQADQLQARYGELVPNGVAVTAALQPHIYDKTLALIPEEVVRFVQSTQPQEFAKLEDQYGKDAARQLCTRLSRELDRHGTLHVLREGIRDRGARIDLMYPRPDTTRNPEHRTLYQRNRFAIVRHLGYSLDNNNELDLGLFLNGVPLFTAELKNSLTGQRVAQAVKQYRTNRDPQERLFKFRRCLAHFAVGNEEVFYTTRLQGNGTFFLPYNLGLPGGGAGNPSNPNGHQTAYLWQDTWAKDSVLELVAHFLLVQQNEERRYDPNKGEVVTKKSETLIFPRFHQRDVVRRVLAKAAQEGPGHNYLVQHSAGSGKSNSIAWLAHGLTRLHDARNERIFQTVVVVTDRRVLDGQLQRTIAQFERTPGKVVPIDTDSGALRDALVAGKSIVITSLQKFSVIADAVEGLKGRSFGVRFQIYRCLKKRCKQSLTMCLLTLMKRWHFKSNLMRDDLHELLLSWRKDSGLSQSDVATALRLTRQTVANIETGRRQPAPYELSTLLEQYGKTSRDLRTRPTTHRKIRFRSVNLDRYDPVYTFLDSGLHARIEAHLTTLKAHPAHSRQLLQGPFGKINLSNGNGEIAKAISEALRVPLAPALKLNHISLLSAVNAAGIAHVFAAHMDPTISEVFTLDEELGSVIYINVADALGRQNYSIVHAMGHAILDQATNIADLSTDRQEHICDLPFANLFLSYERVFDRYQIVKQGRNNFTIASLIELADRIGASVEATCLALEKHGLAAKGRWRNLRERNININKIRQEKNLPAPIVDVYGPLWIPGKLSSKPIMLQ